MGKNCALQMLRHITSFKEKRFLLIAHNATYDYRFLINHLLIENSFEKGKNLMCIVGKFNIKEILEVSPTVRLAVT